MFANLCRFSLLLAILLAASAVAQSDDAPTSGTTALIEEAVALIDQTDVPIQERIARTEAILREHPGAAEVWAALGELRRDAGEDEAALLAFERAVAKDDSLYSAWHWIGILNKRERRDLDRALEAFQQAIDHGARKSRELNEIAVTLAYKGRMAEALQTWEETIADDPGWAVPYANAIKAALYLDDEDKAQELFEAGIKADEFEENIALHWGQYLLNDGDEDEAADVYRRALERAPENAVLRFYYGLALRESGDEDAAIENLKRAYTLGLKEGRPDVYEAANEQLFATRYPKEWKRLQKAAKTVFANHESQEDIVKAAEKGLKILNPIISDHPDIWNAYLVRGVAYRRMNEPALAKRDLRRVLELSPNEPNACIHLAMLHRDLDEMEDATKYAHEAAEAAPRDPSILANAAFVFLDADDCKSARMMFDRARDLVPEGSIPADQDPLFPLQDEIQANCGQ
ncbi:tetratricopeptide repeat protein [bacterium]|nr:tetratricopeptide repeat protein [bacterium]